VHSRATPNVILVGEDDAEVRDFLGMTLRCSGYDVYTAADGEEVLAYLRAGRPASAILLDIMMPNMDGFEALREIRQMQPDLPVIMLSGMSSPLNVVQAIKSGATNFLAKPINHEDLRAAIEQAVGAPGKPAGAGEKEAGEAEREVFFGRNPVMAALRCSLPRVAASSVPVLIQGETGSGKEVLARQIHALSPRAGAPFVKLNCAAVPSELLESELFGYERGAFTGAFQRKAGVFEMADGGTILLDEIGDMDIRLQAKLLQVLQDQEFRRLGGTETVQVNVRVISATHRDLLECIREDAFREDLYYRLNVFTLVLPSLRERQEDIPGLAEFLLKRHSPADAPPLALTPGLREALATYPWPGNIRQLENVIRKLLVLRDPDLIARELDGMRPEPIQQERQRPLAARPRVLRKQPAAEPGAILAQASRAKEEAEVEAILETLNRTRWNRKQAAALLNIDYKALLYKMKKLAIEERSSVSLSA
jgi:two-component system response regulator AtoC